MRCLVLRVKASQKHSTPDFFGGATNFPQKIWDSLLRFAAPVARFNRWFLVGSSGALERLFGTADSICSRYAFTRPTQKNQP